MSIGVLEGGAEPPDKWGPEWGMFEFRVPEPPLVETDTPATYDQLMNTQPYGRVIIHFGNRGHQN